MHGSVACSAETLEKVGVEMPSWIALSENETPQSLSTGGRRWLPSQARQCCGAG